MLAKNADYEVDERLERLGLDYIDLLLLHHTAAYDEQAYQAMERGVKAGKIHSIGLSRSALPLASARTSTRTTLTA